MPFRVSGHDGLPDAFYVTDADGTATEAERVYHGTALKWPGPDHPENVRTTISRRAITVLWDGEAAATSYDVRYKLSTATEYTIVRLNSATAQTVINVTANGTYNISVRTVTADAGPGEWSDDVNRIVNYTPPPVTPPPITERAPTTAPTITLVSNSRTTISFRIGTVPDGLLYYWRRKTGATSYSSWFLSTSRLVSRTGLTENTSYTFQAQARNNAGSGPTSGDIVLRTLSNTDPPAIPSLSLTSTQNGIRGVIGSVSRATGYEYRWRGGTRANYPSGWTSLGTAQTLSITGLAANTSYDVQVRAVNAHGNSGARARSIRTKAAPVVETRPATPSVRYTSTTTGITGRITRVSGATGYRYRHQSGTTYSAWTSTTSLTFNITGLTQNTSYSIQVQAVNTRNSATNRYSSSRTNSVRTAVAAPSSAPTVTWTSTTSSITWNLTAVARATSYQAQFSGTSTWFAITGRSYTISSLAAGGIARTLRFRAINSGGNGPASALVTGTTKAAPVSPPASAPSVSVSSTSSTITWTLGAVTGATSYERQFSGSGVWVSMGSSRTYTISNLGSGVGRTLRYRARNSGGAGPPSALVTGTTTAGTTTYAVPTNFSLAANVASVLTVPREGTHEDRVTRFTIRCTLPAGAAGWDFVYSTTPSFENYRILSYSGSAGNVVATTDYRNIAVNRLYFGRVRARYSGGNSDWSDAIVFFAYAGVQSDRQLRRGQTAPAPRYGFAQGDTAREFGDALQSAFGGFNESISSQGRGISNDPDAGKSLSGVGGIAGIVGNVARIAIRSGLAARLARAARAAAQAGSGGGGGDDGFPGSDPDAPPGPK